MTTRFAYRASPAAKRTAWLPLVLLVCAALAVAGGVSDRHALSVAAAVLLLLAWLPAVWRQRSPVAAGVWLGLAALLLVPAGMGHPVLALMALPVVIMAAVAWAFARTLRRGEEPLVTRCVRVIEGDAHLELPGVRAYTRGVTVFWACLLAAMAALSLLIALFAVPGGWLATLGLRPSVAVPGSLLAWYPDAGCWGVLVAAFVGEYLFRRWHLRHLPHPPARRFIVQMVRRWPALVRGRDTAA